MDDREPSKYAFYRGPTSRRPRLNADLSNRLGSRTLWRQAGRRRGRYHSPGVYRAVTEFGDIDGLYRAHGPGLFRYLLGGTGDRAAAEDMLHDVFAAVLILSPEHRIESLSPEVQRAYLFTAARNGLYRYWRTRAARPIGLVDLPDRWVDPQASMDDRDDLDALLRAVAGLSVDDRVIVIDHAIAGRRIRELAAEYGISEAAAYKRWQRAVRRLSKALGTHEPPAGPRNDAAARAGAHERQTPRHRG